MARTGLAALLCATPLLVPLAALAQSEGPAKEPEAAIDGYLLAQCAMLQGEMYLLQRSTYHPPLDPGAFPGGKAMLFDDTVHREAAIRRDCTLVKRLYRPVWRGP